MESNDIFDVFDVKNEEKKNDAKRLKTNQAMIGEIEKEMEEDEENLDTSEFDDLPCIMIHTLETEESCSHEVAVPPGMDYIPLNDPFKSKSTSFSVKSESILQNNNVEEIAQATSMQVSEQTHKFAKEYPFTLDPFQKEAIKVLENYQSVLVAAHTSAGKTAIAEYAIAMSLRDKQRVIYTTPIKALSNQKYRELYEEFKDVGLMTGDITINPTASCLVMTTEILRSMLYKGSEVMREVGWVIFDEIHYMRDKERGVVWEETIILLPDKVHYVFLSATIPNATQFAEWICYLHHQPCHVVYTEYRPTPLQHYVFPNNGDCLYLVVDENGDFNEGNFSQAMSALKDAGENNNQARGRKGGSTQAQSDVFKLIKMIMERDFQPVIVFSFSRKDCEFHALQMSKLDFNTLEEKTLLEEVFNNAIEVLSEEDKKLPQIHHLLPILRKGIGIHHSGLLPIIKETIEILFSEGLIKALFATETFAMGLNMPARTVLFTSCRKYDGTNYRWISSGEYIQMSGRAGRRGIDDKGIVIMMIDQRMGSDVGKNIIKGKADPLNSAFHLTYNMVLNLLRVEGINPEYMLEKSFHQFQNYSAIPALREKIAKIDGELGLLNVDNEQDVSKFYKLRSKLDELGRGLQALITKPQYILPYLQPGRMVKIKHKDMEFDWGIVLNYHRRIKKRTNNYSALFGGTNNNNARGTNDKLNSNSNNDNNNKYKRDNNYDNNQNQTEKSADPENDNTSNKYEYIVDVLLHITKLKPGQETSTRYVRPAEIITPQGSPSPLSTSTPKAAASKKLAGKINSHDFKANERMAKLQAETNEMQVVPVLLPCIHKISSVRLYHPDDLRTADSRQSVYFNIQEVKRRFSPSNDATNTSITSKSSKNLKRKGNSPDSNLTNHVVCNNDGAKINDNNDSNNNNNDTHNKKPLFGNYSPDLYERIPLLDPIADMNITDPALQEIIKKMELYESKIYGHKMFNKPEMEIVYKNYSKKMELIKDRQITYEELQKTMALIKMDELKYRKRVLRRLGFTTVQDVIELKGRVACEISTGDELVLTELMFNGAFNDLTADQITALLSCFVFQEKSNEIPKLEGELAVPLKMIQETARRIAKVSRECKLEIDELDYVNRFKPNLMDVVYSWSKGAPFHEIIKMTDVFEGSIIRCMRRLEELLREMIHSAKAIGNTDLENKFIEGCTKIKRDIIFAASLYL